MIKHKTSNQIMMELPQSALRVVSVIVMGLLIGLLVATLPGCATGMEARTYKTGDIEVVQVKQFYHHRWIPCLIPADGKISDKELRGIKLPDIGAFR